MDPSHAAGLGPPPFRFTPSQGPQMRSVAYTLPFRLLATAIAFAAAAWLVALWESGRLGTDARALATWFTAGVAMLLYTWWNIVRSVTTLDATELRQTWMWTKRMELAELAYAHVIRIRGLEWLVAPRIYVRTLVGKFAVFYAAEAGMLGEFERLVRELEEFRRMR